MWSHADLQASWATSGCKLVKERNMLCRKAMRSVMKLEACPFGSTSSQS
ncbi:hypothetical protein L798_01522 [Zootermopsis nevadensis]|uniref:Uncharacterized protein n=1 Tax=Zootermopsis nevadensis TaxID=136037 RepID=A0A067QIG8_ZOONE|nr:hypothetical protein L798_01522 [Zootermopsis nevadensis]